MLHVQPSCLGQLTSKETGAECVTKMECEMNIFWKNGKPCQVDQNFGNERSGKGCFILFLTEDLGIFAHQKFGG